MTTKIEDMSATPPTASQHFVRDRGAKLLKKHSAARRKSGEVTEQLQAASQTQLVVRRFRKHRVARVSLYLLALLYLIALLAEFVAPYSPNQRFANQLFASPSTIHFVDSAGQLSWPFIYKTESRIEMATFAYRSEVVGEPVATPIQFFVTGSPHRLLGLIPSNLHLFGTESGEPVFLLGADNLGRDLLSRIIHASRVSLFVGLAGVAISFVVGVVLGGISGYFGGRIDSFIQRLVDFILSIPQIPLWMGLSAAIPREWTGIQTFFAITIILSLVGWTGLARVVRSKVMSLRQEDYVTAARISSAGDMTIIRRHLLPGVTSYLIVYITLAIPGMILGETTLSFLGLGINPPDVSWGTLLQDAQDLTVLANYPWLLWPCAFVMLAVILFNFVGDGLRDAADPYS